MFVTVYLDLETYHTQAAEGQDFYASLTQGDRESVQLSVPTQAVYASEDDEMVLIKAEVARRANAMSYQNAVPKGENTDGL